MRATSCCSVRPASVHTAPLTYRYSISLGPGSSTRMRRPLRFPLVT
jgi:hypothetical protein